jgi:hypothetical protein
MPFGALSNVRAPSARPPGSAAIGLLNLLGRGNAALRRTDGLIQSVGDALRRAGAAVPDGVEHHRLAAAGDRRDGFRLLGKLWREIQDHALGAELARALSRLSRGETVIGHGPAETPGGRR